MRTRAKICGITRCQDIQAVVDSGADAIGLVFYPPSPRSVTIAQAVELAQATPAYVQLVGLFVNSSLEEIQATLQAVPLDVLQFHGDESPEHCQAIAKATGLVTFDHSSKIHISFDLNGFIPTSACCFGNGLAMFWAFITMKL